MSLLFTIIMFAISTAILTIGILAITLVYSSSLCKVTIISMVFFIVWISFFSIIENNE